jgi:hypothetical protein
MKKKPIFFLLFLIAKITLAQIESPSIGGSLHLGSISGNSSSVSSIGGTIFFDFYPWFEHDASFRASFTYSQMLEKFLPENRTGRYYPLIKSFSLKGFIRQDFSFPFYIEEGAGFIYLNDRTFSDVNVWETGIGFSALVGYDFRKIDKNGFSVGLGIDYGITFTHTTVNYFLVNLQTQYYF